MTYLPDPNAENSNRGEPVFFPDGPLIVKLPDGTTMCNDNGVVQFEPVLTLENPATGRYLIWVGATHGSFNSKLAISE